MNSIALHAPPTISQRAARPHARQSASQKMLQYLHTPLTSATTTVALCLHLRAPACHHLRSTHTPLPRCQYVQARDRQANTNNTIHTHMRMPCPINQALNLLFSLAPASSASLSHAESRSALSARTPPPRSCARSPHESLLSSRAIPTLSYALLPLFFPGACLTDPKPKIATCQPPSSDPFCCGVQCHLFGNDLIMFMRDTKRDEQALSTAHSEIHQEGLRRMVRYLLRD